MGMPVSNMPGYVHAHPQPHLPGIDSGHPDTHRGREVRQA